jgi:hypothetical protein
MVVMSFLKPLTYQWETCGLSMWIVEVRLRGPQLPEPSCFIVNMNATHQTALEIQDMSVLMESGSSLGTFLDCPKKYEYSYIKLLSSKSYSRALGFGTLMHSFLEDFWNKSEFPTASGRELKRMLSEHMESDHTKIMADHALARDAAQSWIKMWSGDFTDLHNEKLVPLSIEKEWSINAGDRHYVGKSDGRMMHVGYGGNFLYEIKTSGSTNRDSYKHNLELNRQINGNLLAMIEEGIKPLGVIYDIIWKPALRLKKEETEDQLMERIAEEYKNFPFKYFERIMVFRSGEDIDDFELDLSSQFRALRSSIDGTRFYRNTNSCEKYGKLCQYFNLCMEDKGKDTSELEEAMFVKREKKLPEISMEFQKQQQGESE